MLMVYLYIDESGDLGFTEKSKKYFILTAVKVSDEETQKKLSRITKKIRQRIFSKKLKKMTELKFSNTRESIRCMFLEKAAELPIQVYLLIVEKKKFEKIGQEDIIIFYSYLVKQLVNIIYTHFNDRKELFICLDRCLPASERDNLERYFKTEFLSLFKEIPKLVIDHQASHNNGCLQVTDFICGALGCKYNHGDDKYAKIIQDKITIEKNAK